MVDCNSSEWMDESATGLAVPPVHSKHCSGIDYKQLLTDSDNSVTAAAAAVNKYLFIKINKI